MKLFLTLSVAVTIVMYLAASIYSANFYSFLMARSWYYRWILGNICPYVSNTINDTND